MKTELERFKVLPIESIVVLSEKTIMDNPNMYERRKDFIQNHGQAKPIYTRKNESGLTELVSGIDILNCLIDLGGKTVICYDLGKLSLPEAYLAALKIDLIRFEYDEIALGGIIEGLTKHYSMEDLYAKIPLSPHKVNKLLEYPKHNWEKSIAEEKLKNEQRQAKKLQKLTEAQQRKADQDLEKALQAGESIYKHIKLNLF